MEEQSNFPAPATELKLNSGEVITVGGAKDRPQVINFWASWCPPCRAEFSELEDFFAAHKDTIYMFAVSEDETAEDMQSFLNERSENYDALIAVLDEEHIAGQNFEVEYLPTTFIVDKNGDVKAFHVGGITRDVLENSLALVE